MRSCELNKQVVSWKKFNKVTETENTAGEKTGVYTKTYNTPVPLSINVVSGSAIKNTMEAYGIVQKHEKILYMPKADFIALGVTKADIFILKNIDSYPNTENYKITGTYDTLNEVLIGLDTE